MTEYKFTNELFNETSPYLLSHSHNPVNWKAWNKNTLDTAKNENKLLIISIGYSACHWCHVMERESFEDVEVAEIMNKNYTSIKVDREERPDVDQVYMNAAMLINGSGGWPLNAIALPDGRPIYAGTYFPKQNWIKLLNQITTIWNNEPQKLIEQADSITDGINKSETLELNENSNVFNKNDIKKITESILRNVDFDLGGTLGQPKFPLPVGYDYLLDSYYHSNDKRSLEAVEITLKNMALGGIYDQIGGGFARYSVDKYWHAPHFEKMLYDNAQLISLYSKAYQITQNNIYKKIVYVTVDFIERELTSPEFGFYSALDADSEGVEGKYYVWQKSEITELLGEHSELICKYYNITKEGNWEGNNILHPSFTPEEFAVKFELKTNEFLDILNFSNKKLLSFREKRIHPALDDKILTSWNALTIKGLVTAYSVFQDDKFLQLALKNAHFILEKLINDDAGIKRNYKNNKATISAYLDDYANVIEAFIELHQSTFDERWILTAKKLLEYTIENFLNPNNGMYYYTSKLDEKLIARKSELHDNVMPGSNSIMAWNLFRIGKLFGETKLVEASEQMIKNIYPSLIKGNFYYANWSRLLLNFVNPFSEIVILGDKFSELKSKIESAFFPNKILAGGNTEGNLSITHNRLIKDKTILYLCRNNSCSLPIEKYEDLLKELD